eukprot:3365434-Prymnesium_polylepis.1
MACVMHMRVVGAIARQLAVRSRDVMSSVSAAWPKPSPARSSESTCVCTGRVWRAGWAEGG